MFRGAVLWVGVFAIGTAMSACERGAMGPAAGGPSTVSNLLLPRLSGNWGGEAVLAGPAGGTGPAVNAGATACEGAAFARVFGEQNNYTLSIAQSGTELTGKMVSASNGLACEYTGSVGSGNTFVMHAEVCTPKKLAFLCPDGTSREFDLAGSSITANFDDRINPTVIRGNTAYTYNVGPPGGPYGAALVATQSIPGLTRR